MLLSPLAHVEPAALAGLAALGAFHGLNPALGWLFAVALGLQQRSAWAVTRALAFITIGHAASLVVVAGFLLLVGAFVPLDWVRILAGVTLLLFGAYKVFRYYRHPRWVGMQVSSVDLVFWSFLMATSHGAGLMLAPIILNLEEREHRPGDLEHHADFLDLADTSAAWGIGLGVHTLAMLLVMFVIAMVVYKKVGLAFLRRGWINVDLFWAVALLLGGVVTLALIWV